MVAASQIKALESAYEELLQQQTSHNGSDTIERTIQSITSFLSAKGWGQHLMEARAQLDSLAEGELLITVAETLAEPQGTTVIASMKRIQEHMARGLMFTALEEALWGIQQAPYYLPLHIRLADVLIEGDRLDEAVQKYLIVAETYRMRGDVLRSIATHRYALKIAPMDIGLRENLIQMLLQVDMIDQAIEQYIAVADAYYQLAQVDQAIAKYSEALQYASAGDPSRQWERNILHRIGDIHVQRVEWREALRVYRRIKRVDPGDERARGYLADLHLKLGQRDQALRELDELIEFCNTRQQMRQVLPVLQELTLSEPQDLALHMRLAKLYIDLQMKDEAVSELDTVGEMQLEAGMAQEAARTIQAIIRLGPRNVEGYRQLLDQLERQL
jgi:tetratricopeptide (TPR) repeat protein